MSTPDYKEQFIDKMRNVGFSHNVIETFVYYYEKLRTGDRGMLPGNALMPVSESEIIGIDELAQTAKVDEYLSKTVVIKLNGGMGTSMGMPYPKSLVPVKNDLTFLDIFLRQKAEFANRLTTPPVLMNSFYTDAETRQALSKRPAVGSSPDTFLQNSFPKVEQEMLAPVRWPENPELEWNPPGHGDIYLAASESGTLDRLLKNGIRYAFISNADNLGAVLDERILCHFAENNYPFLMEVALRDESDVKGGHLAKRRDDGRLVLRELSQCPPEEQSACMDIDRFPFFNTNNIWFRLDAIRDKLDFEGVLQLPMIANTKTVDPRNENTPDVYQLETAMGAAISLFSDSTAVRVNRDRYIPVKKTQQILCLMSDAYFLTETYRLQMNLKRPADLPGPYVVLDDQYYKKIDELRKRFPHGAPSLVECESLRVEGDVTFQKNITVKGRVHIRNQTGAPREIPDNTVLDHDISFP